MDIELVLDCADLERMRTFWTAALGYEHMGSAAQYSVLRDPDRRRPRLLLQQVAEPKVGKNRVHVDLSAADIEAEAARLETLGASRVPDGKFAELGTEWIQMLDPEGNEVCVCKEFDDDSGRPTLGVSPTLHRYVLDHTEPRDEIARSLIDETAELGPLSRLQISSEQGALMEMITRLTGARSTRSRSARSPATPRCAWRGDFPTTARCSAATSTRSGPTSAVATGSAPASHTRSSCASVPPSRRFGRSPEQEQFDIAFIDADKPSYGLYFDEIVPRLRAGGLVLVDNVLWSGRVVDPQADDENTVAIRAFNDKVSSDRRVESVILPLSDGLTLARKR